MKRFILLILVLQIYFFCSKTFGQVTQFPYLESFENEPFTQGENVYFITNWFGNYVDDVRIFQENSNIRTGASAIGLWPVVEEGEDEEEVEVFAQVSLDLKGLENVVTNFWVATVATGEMKHVKLYLKLSLDGGVTFGPKFIMGTDYRGFVNKDTPYKEFFFALHPNAFNNSNVVLKFLAKAGAKKGNPAKILIDDVSIYTVPEDIFPPIAVEPAVKNVNEIDILFSEPIDESALHPTNYTFINAVPVVGSVTRLESDLVRLNLSTPISIGKYYDLEIANIRDLAGNTMVTSTAELIYNPLTEGLVITEIMYDEPPVEQNDNLEFIELHNSTDVPIELGGLRIKGGIASGKLPEYTLLPGDYWITAKNASAFTSFFGVSAHEWHGANLSNDEPELIYIQNTDHHSGVMIDSLTYTIGEPWPDGAAGQGYSMELINPLLDNSNPINWKNSNNYVGNYNGADIYASPGSANSVLGIRDLSKEKMLNIYPNPVRDLLIINSQVKITKVEIYSILGKKVQEKKTNFNSIQLSGLSNGVYIVKIYFETEFMFKKIIKN